MRRSLKIQPYRIFAQQSRKAIFHRSSKYPVLVYLCSDDEKVFHYERDLIRQINENNKVVAQIAVSPSGIVIPGVNLDCVVAATNPGELQKNEYACIPYVLVGQLFRLAERNAALMTAIELGHTANNVRDICCVSFSSAILLRIYSVFGCVVFMSFDLKVKDFHTFHYTGYISRNRSFIGIQSQILRFEIAQ